MNVQPLPLAALVAAMTLAGAAVHASEPPQVIVLDGADPAGRGLQIAADLGSFEEHVCRTAGEVSPTHVEALAALKARAAATGATGLATITFDRRTDFANKPCWQRLSARGEALILRPDPAR